MRFDELLVERIGQLIQRYPTFGYRKLWAMLRFKQGVKVNRKAVRTAPLVSGDVLSLGKVDLLFKAL